MLINYNRNLVERSRELRKNMTPQERHLWYDFLKNYPVRFNRQRIIGNFIVDFYCKEAKLVIEIDGSQHFTDEGLAYDAERDSILKAFGLDIIRFSNREIDSHFEGVCCIIDKKVRSIITPSVAGGDSSPKGAKLNKLRGIPL